jgi:DNA-binding transcriptional regulator LsrR (DeoR family)
MAKRVPADFAGDVLLWAAWLYHVEGRTQNDIAEELEVSRQTVANYLNEAVAKDMVRVELRPDILARHATATALADLYGLEAVHIVPTPKSESQLFKRLGHAGGQVLHNLVSNGDLIGVAFGRTIFRVGMLMPASNQSKTKVVQVAGCSLGGSDTSPEACASLIAGKLSAECVNLFAPAYLSTETLTRDLLAEPTLQRQFQLFEKTNLMIFGIGELNKHTRFYLNEEYFHNDDLRDHYLRLGAASVIMGRFIDADGQEIDGPLLKRTVAIDLDTARAIPVRLAVCGGKEKTEAADAALRARFATHLVTDEQTARRLLKANK